MVSHLPSMALQGCYGLYTQYRQWWFRAGELSSGSKLGSPVFGAPPREVWTCSPGSRPQGDCAQGWLQGGLGEGRCQDMSAELNKDPLCVTASTLCVVRRQKRNDGQKDLNAEHSTPCVHWLFLEACTATFINPLICVRSFVAKAQLFPGLERK